jgi:hypothetical protein
MKKRMEQESLQGMANAAWANSHNDMVNSPPHYNQGLSASKPYALPQTKAISITCKETSSSTSGAIATRTASKT